MSLFKLREFWTVRETEDESFDQNSMLVSTLNSGCDFIITGSHSGVLRIFRPSSVILESNELSGFSPTDLQIEKSFDSPIIQLGCGRLASGSLQIHLAVLQPRVLSIFNLKVQNGIAEHGTQHYLDLLYEHHLESSAANFVVGPFGSALNRDFICVQSLDGILSFYEQESPSFKSTLPDFLLPGPIAYLQKTDCFITITSSWNLTAYKYNQLAEMGHNVNKSPNNGGKLLSEWCVMLGEMAVDITVVDGAWLLVLGERNLYCFNMKGKIRFTKHLGYYPMCCHVYSKDEDIFSLVVSENSTLLIYQNTTLRWSAKVQFQPVCVGRVFLQQIQGAVVVLSEEGRLECNYLGTDPSLFVAPPLQMKPLDLEKVEEELNTLNKTLKSLHGQEGVKHLAQSSNEKELNIRIAVETVLEPCTYSTMLNQDGAKMCAITIDIIPQTQLEEIQISLTVFHPLKVTPQVHRYSNVSEKVSCISYAYINADYDIPSLEVQLVATAITNLGFPKCLTESVWLPLKLVAETCQAEKEAEHKLTVVINQSPVPLAVMFSDLMENSTVDPPNSALGIQYKTNGSAAVTVLLAKSSNRYRIQSNSLASLSLAIEQIILRLHKHYSNTDDIKIVFGSSLPGNEVVPYIANHFKASQLVNELETELNRYSWLFRQIEKRLIVKLKAKVPTPLNNLQVLMNETFNDIHDASIKLVTARLELSKTQNQLSCILKLLQDLISLLDLNEKTREILKAAFCPVVEDMEEQNWESIVDSSLCFLLRSVLAKSDKDKLRTAQTNFEGVKDISRLEKHFIQIIERINKKETQEPDETSIEATEEDSQEILENEELRPVGSQFGEASSRLLSARKSLLRKRLKEDS